MGCVVYTGRVRGTGSEGGQGKVTLQGASGSEGCRYRLAGMEGGGDWKRGN